jgi:hypothetical protein
VFAASSSSELSGVISVLDQSTIEAQHLASSASIEDDSTERGGRGGTYGAVSTRKKAEAERRVEKLLSMVEKG